MAVVLHIASILEDGGIRVNISLRRNPATISGLRIIAEEESAQRPQLSKVRLHPQQRRALLRQAIFCGYNNLVRFTYDPAKNERNVAERGLSFDLASELDWSSALIAEDTRQHYPERRYQALGWIGEHLHMLVFTPREGAVHVISLRRANQRKEPICHANLTLS